MLVESAAVHAYVKAAIDTVCRSGLEGMSPSVQTVSVESALVATIVGTTELRFPISRFSRLSNSPTTAYVCNGKEKCDLSSLSGVGVCSPHRNGAGPSRGSRQLQR